MRPATGFCAGLIRLAKSACSEYAVTATCSLKSRASAPLPTSMAPASVGTGRGIDPEKIRRKAVEKALGDKVETAFLENVAEGPDAERAIERLAREGCKVIFTTSFGFMEPTLKVAKKFPDVKFEHATGYQLADNVTTYNAKFHEGRYVIGQIAAKMSKSGTAGYIVSFPIPEVIAGINAFMLGAQSVNPDFKVKIVWANTWFDPGKEADAAKALQNVKPPQ